MRLLHILPKETFFKYLLKFEDKHYHDLSNGMVVSIVRSSQDVLDAFEAEPNVIALPHPQSGAPVGPSAAEYLKDYGVLASDNLFQACQKLRRTANNIFSPSTF